MKVFMIGGTGLLGSEAAKELIARGHEVTSIALPPLPAGAVLPPEMKIEYGNYLEMTDDEIRAHFKGCEGFVFAAGVDERVEGPAPIYNLYKKYNIDPVKRLLKLAKECGVVRGKTQRHSRLVLFVLCEKASRMEAHQVSPVYPLAHRSGECGNEFCRERV